MESDKSLDDLLDWILQHNTVAANGDPSSNEVSCTEPKLPNIASVAPTKNDTHSSNTSSPSEGEDEEEEYEPTESQLKMMTPKERRKWRNKISARNFRDRRKKYMTNLESKMNKLQEENYQLKLEVKWVRDMMNKLQSENDQLRLELALCRGGIQPLPNMLSTPALQHPPPPPPLPFQFATENQPYTNSNIYLEHTTIPSWDLTSLYRKESTADTSSELIQKYPLLAPALMSIVLQQAMKTNEIMATVSPLYDGKNSNDLIALSDSNNTTPTTNPNDSDSDEKVRLAQVKAYIQDHCPLLWLQKQFCLFVLCYVVVRFPRLERPCKTYLPICKKYRIRS